MISKGRILIIDDEKDIRFLLSEILQDEGYAVAEAAHSEAAYADIAAHGMPDLVILDIWLENSDRDGMEILSDLKKRSKLLPVLMISGHGNIEMAVKAIKLGAYDFIEKPFNTDRLLHLVTRAFESARARRGVSSEVSFISQSPEMQATLKLAQKAAQTDSRILITGVWGAGRAHLARYIHQDSGRAGRACLMLPSATVSLLELAEACGHEGTLLLRDVQNLPLPLQHELLARLNTKIEARIIATASHDIELLKNTGQFLPDLYERLCVNHIVMPQLEARRLDLADLCMYLTTQYREAWGMTGAVRITDDAKMHLLSASFEAQAHDLHIICKRAALRMRQDHTVELNVQDFGVSGETTGQGGILPEWLQTDLRTAREAFERWYFDHLMARFADNVTQVAQFAGMDRTALYRKLKSIKTDDDNSDTEAA